MVEFGGMLHEPLGDELAGPAQLLTCSAPRVGGPWVTDSSEICSTTGSKAQNYSQGAQDCHRTLKKPNTMEC